MTQNRSLYQLLATSKPLDRRINAARGDLADVALAGKFFVPHYAVSLSKTVNCDRVGVYAAPDKSTTMVSELLRGEAFMMLDCVGGWAWGYCAHDHYVGYVEAGVLGEGAATSVVASASDYLETAEKYLGAPYLWGGRSLAGIDCSGLVQIALASVGVAAPRDTDQQMAALGTEVAADAPLQRGDLIFFPGHVGIMVDNTNMVHATGFHGQTVIEPLANVVLRISENHAQPILARKRLP